MTVKPRRGSMQMRIETIDVDTLLFAYPINARFRYAGGTCTHRVSSVIRVVTDTGEIGIGSVYSHPRLVQTIVTEQLAPMLRGQDPTDVERLWRIMYGLTRWYGRKGVAVSALGGVEMALWDLRGKAAKTPVWRLLGGKNVKSVPAYASALLWEDDVAVLGREAHRHLERGFRRMKMRLGRNWRYDLDALEAVTSACGRDGELMVDGSLRYSVDRAALLARELEARKVVWFEEPFEPEEIDAYVALQLRSRVPLAAGENEFGLQGFRELLRADAVDIVQADACRCGGIGETMAVGRLAAAHDKRLAPHTWSDAIAVMANAHCVAASPNGFTVEVDQTGNPFIDTLLRDPLEISDGRLRISDAPGLGIALDERTIARHRLAADMPLPEGAYSDMVFGPDHLRPAPPYDDEAAATRGDHAAR